MHLSRCSHCPYLDLLVLMWRTPGCSVPDDNEWLGRHLRMTTEEVQNELRPLIVEFCTTTNNRVFQKRLLREFEWSLVMSEKQRLRAKSRWDKEKDLCRGNATSGNANNQASGNASVSVSVTESKKERERPRKRGSPKILLAEDWSPSPESFSPSDTGELEKMRDWARANGARKVDWEAAWRNWKRRAAEFRGKGGQVNGHTTSNISDFEARWNANTAKQLADRESWEVARAASKNKAN
jgi:uncharacterized protein YdaU (DUF1376 family)